MELLERFELILSQGLDELAQTQVDEESDSGLDLQALLAPTLGDILYRLTIEHGVSYTTFRDTVISLISESKPQRAVAGSRGTDGDGRPFAARLAKSHSLIILALEMMPPDTPY